jgi:pSer/pThr/pTyr-binding forkhead associated (FHA) protein
MKSTFTQESWSLEIVKGRDTGVRYELAAGKTIVLGVGAETTLNLARHEIDGPRRIEAKHAEIGFQNDAPAIRDLDSRGGTFVNRKRLLQGRVETLSEGDIVQLAGVQLKVVKSSENERDQAAPPSAVERSELRQPTHRSSTTTAHTHAGLESDILTPKPPAASPKTSAHSPKPPAPTAKTPSPAPVSPPSKPPQTSAAKSVPPTSDSEALGRSNIQHDSPRSSGSKQFLYTLPSGSTCRGWDDFLTVAAQRWRELRDELTSGKLERFLISIGRADLAPAADDGESPDVRLDRWLDGLPTTKAAVPELDAYPPTIKIKASRKGGGGIVKATLRVSNTGYRLLRSNIRIDADSITSLRVPAEFERPFLTIDETTIPIETTIPETLTEPVRRGLVVESNGGSKHIEVLIELADPVAVDPLADDQNNDQTSTFSIADWSIGRRAVLFCFAAALARTLVALGGVFATGFAGSAAAFAIAGSLLGAASAVARKSLRDLPFAVFAGGVGGMIVASPAFALAAAIEPLLGGLGRIAPLAIALWAGVAAVAAVLSVRIAPPAATPSERPLSP